MQNARSSVLAYGFLATGAVLAANFVVPSAFIRPAPKLICHPEACKWTGTAACRSVLLGAVGAITTHKAVQAKALTSTRHIIVPIGKVGFTCTKGVCKIMPTTVRRKSRRYEGYWADDDSDELDREQWDADDDDESLLHEAAERGDTETISKQLKDGADIEERFFGRTPLHMAAESGQVEACKLLIEEGARVNAMEDWVGTPLHSTVVKDLEEMGASGLVSAAFGPGDTPLIKAAFHNHLETMKLLIEKGGNVNAAGALRMTPLMFSARDSHVEAMKLLFENGANASAADLYSETPVHMAASNGHVEATKLLVEKGADVNAKDHFGDTPLHDAAASSVEVMKLLVENNAFVNAIGANALTPLGIAKRQAEKYAGAEKGQILNTGVEYLESLQE